MFVTKKRMERELKALKDEMDEKIDVLYSTVSDMGIEQQSVRKDLTGAIAKSGEMVLGTLREEAKALFLGALSDYRKQRYDAETPFVEIVSEDFTEEGGVQIRLDWNKTFIKYLKEHGFTGNSEEAIVDSWVSSLSRDRVALDKEFAG